jgi:D-alanine-D-alanine ligase-like ATP-grasp enzyme
MIEKKLSRHGFQEYANIKDIYNYISSTIGYPCFIKPNARGQGNGVIKCFNREDVEFAVSEYQRNRHDIVIVEEAVDWPDYRVIVLQGQVILCYLRKPLYLIGDGESTIKALFLQKQESLAKSGRDTLIDMHNSHIARKLARNSYTLETILKPGEIYQACDISNLSVGGEAEDYTPRISQHWCNLCSKLVADMGLIFCGVDLACTDLEDAHAQYSILEINSSPGLDHYATSGEKQATMVKELYRKILNDYMGCR